MWATENQQDWHNLEASNNTFLSYSISFVRLKVQWQAVIKSEKRDGVIKGRIWLPDGKQVILKICLYGCLCYRNSEKEDKPVQVSFSPELLLPLHFSWTWWVASSLPLCACLGLREQFSLPFPLAQLRSVSASTTCSSAILLLCLSWGQHKSRDCAACHPVTGLPPPVPLLPSLKYKHK